MLRRAESGLDVNLKLARELLRAQGGDGSLHLDREKLTTPNGRVLDGTTDVVDKVREIAGGTATIFRGDLRVSTNVLKPEGSRGTGTRLAPGPVYDAVLGKGLPYRGQADVLGVPYLAAYEPLKDDQGRTIGILYVGAKKLNSSPWWTACKTPSSSSARFSCFWGEACCFWRFGEPSAPWMMCATLWTLSQSGKST